MSRNAQSSKISLACSVATRLCLIVSLWQAPIPWLHSHGTNVSKSASVIAARELNTHLATYHSLIEIDDDADLGWHCHWVMPFWNHLFHNSSNDELPSQKAFAFDSATITANQIAFADAPWLTGEVTASVPHLSEQIDQGCKFQIESLRSIPRPQTFSILRC